MLGALLLSLACGLPSSPLELQAQLRHALDSSHLSHALGLLQQMGEIADGAETGRDRGALLGEMVRRESEVRGMCEDFTFGLATHSDRAVAETAAELGERFGALLERALAREQAAERAAAAAAAAEAEALVEAGEEPPLHWTEQWFLDMDANEDKYVSPLELEAFALSRYADVYHVLREAKVALVPHELRAADEDGSQRVTLAELRAYCGDAKRLIGGAVSGVCAPGSAGADNLLGVEAVVLPGGSGSGAAAAAAGGGGGGRSAVRIGVGMQGELSSEEFLAFVTVARLVADDVAAIARFTDQDGDGELTLYELQKNEAPLAAFKRAQDNFSLPAAVLQLVEVARSERGGAAGSADDSAAEVVAAAEAAKAAAKATREAAAAAAAKEQAAASAAAAKVAADKVELAAAALAAAQEPLPGEGDEEDEAAGEAAPGMCADCSLGTSGPCFIEQDDGSRLCFDVEEDGNCSLGAENCANNAPPPPREPTRAEQARAQMLSGRKRK